MTHAIHNTPIFLVFGGGLLWLGVFLMSGRREVAAVSRELTVLTLIMVGTLLDSAGQNLALTPSFGLALAVLYAWVRSFRGIGVKQILGVVTARR